MSPIRSVFSWDNVGKLLAANQEAADGAEDSAAALNTEHLSGFLCEAVSTTELAELVAVLRNLPLSLIILRPNSSTIWLVSRVLAQQLEAPVSSLEGHDLFEVVELSDYCLAEMRTCLRTDEVTEMDIQVLRKSGQPLNVVVNVMGVPTAYGRVGIALGGDIIK